MSSYLEQRRQHILDGRPPKVKPAKSPRKESPKMNAVKQELKKLYTMFLKKRSRCEIKSPECTKVATCIHHRNGRGKDELMDQGTWMASCMPCNSYVEVHDKWARERGFKGTGLKNKH